MRTADPLRSPALGCTTSFRSLPALISDTSLARCGIFSVAARLGLGYLLAMKISHLLRILDPTALSPEELAPRLGISNMTYRRWQKKPKDALVPRKYESAVREGLYRLLAEGLLDPNRPEVTEIVQESSTQYFMAAFQSLGIPREFEPLASCHEDQVHLTLSKIGSSPSKQNEVNASVREIKGFESFGQEWKKRIKTLLAVIQSKKLSMVDKLVAYGALFYLITPFDLIPDHIPIIGYIDDFAILGFATAYYLSHFPKIFSSSGNYE